MCTALNYVNGHHLFGRNLDLETDYPVGSLIMPRKYPLALRNGTTVENHYATLGVGMKVGGFPLYFDAINEKGLGCENLAFFGMAYFPDPQEGKNNIASFELIPYLLATCATVQEAREKLKDICIDNTAFSDQFPVEKLHWMVGDRHESIVIETTKEKGLVVYDNPYGVMTNCPDFEYQMQNLSYYANVTGRDISIRFARDPKTMWEYSRGMGTIGLPGGTDSVSRFVRATFTKLNSFCDPEATEKNIAEFFHILSNVQQVNGETELKSGKYEITLYTSCLDTDDFRLYYNTYYNPSLNGVDGRKFDLDAGECSWIPFEKNLQVTMQN